MDTKEALKKELSDLLAKEKSLLVLAKDNKDIIKFGAEYQGFYSCAIKMLEFLAPDRLSEFKGYYEVDPKRKLTDITNYNIQDYVMVMSARLDNYDKPLWNTNHLLIIRIVNQFQILASVSSRIESILSDAEGHLYAEIQDEELKAASNLQKINLRAAGALAGVVIERHLQRVAKNHRITIGKNPTISDLNDLLKSGNIYDTPTWRKIQYLADLRNICSHNKKTEPTKKQVSELIEGTNQIVKTIF